MTLRGADLRFAVPHRVATAAVLGADLSPLAEVAAGLTEAGVELRPAGGGPVDLLVARAGDARAGAAEARSTVLVGRARRGQAGGQEMLVVGSLGRPSALVPMRRAPLHHYVTNIAGPTSAAARLRNALVVGALDLGAPPRAVVPATRVLTLLPGSAPGPVTAPKPRRLPWLVDAVKEAGVSADADWALSLSYGDDLQRAVFHLLEGSTPRWVVKFSRVKGAVIQFERDEHGLQCAARAGEVVTRHAPRLLGRFEVEGLAASVETAAPGRQLLGLLERRPLALIDRIADWILEMNAHTAVGPGEVLVERERLRSRILPQWVEAGVSPEILDAVPAVPGVMVHNDLASWNIITDGEEFVVVDWEAARPVGLPLWDLLYFLADVLVRLEGPGDGPTLAQRCVRLFLGQSVHSPRLFAWVRRLVLRLDLPAEAVGPIATLAWLHHGLSPAGRAAALGSAPPASTGHLALFAYPWLTTPGLGVGWSAWR